MNKVVAKYIISAITLFTLTIFADICSFYIFREGDYPYLDVAIVFLCYSFLLVFLCLLFSIPISRSICSIILDFSKKEERTRVPSLGKIYWFCVFCLSSSAIFIGLISAMVISGPSGDLYNFIHVSNYFIAMFVVVEVGFFSPMLELAKAREKKNVIRQKKSEERSPSS